MEEFRDPLKGGFQSPMFQSGHDVFAASKRGDISKLRKSLVKKGRYLTDRHKDAYYAIHVAAAYNHIHVVRYLIERGADVNGTDKNGRTVLGNVILKKESEFPVDVSDTIELLGYLLAHGANVNAPSKYGRTVLHNVVLKSESKFRAMDVSDTIKLLDYLLAHGTDVNATDEDGKTVLHNVVPKRESNFRAVDVSDTIKLLDYLLSHGADVNTPDKYGRTVLHSVIMKEESKFRAVDVSDTIKLLDYLLAHGTDVNATDKDGNMVLHNVIIKNESEFRAVDVSDTIKLLDCLLAHGADVNAPGKYGRTVLHNVILKKESEFRTVDVSDTFKLLDYLLAHGVDVNAIDKMGRTTMHLFILQKEESELGMVDVSDTIKLFDYLLAHGVDVNAANEGDYMKLPYYLVEHGTDVNAVDYLGFTVLHLAVLGGHIDLASYLVEHGTNVNAAITNTIDSKYSGFTALHIVCLQKDNYNELFVDVLLQNGASLEITTPDGYTAVHTAVKLGNTRFVGHIITKYNGNVNLPDNIGRTPLHWAAYMGSTDIIRLLLSREVYQGTQDDQGCTALHLAAMEGHLEACIVLTHASTKKELLMRDKNGSTPFELATTRGHQNVATILCLPHSDNKDNEEPRIANCESSSGKEEEDDDDDDDDDDGENLDFKLFSVSAIKMGTNKLHKSAKIGQGGYGTVYKGFLDNKEVAIKILDDKSTQGKTEFLQEMVVLGQVRHPNLVNLIGACFKLSCLVYEYFPNGSVEDCIKNSPKLLTWQIRTRILYEICLALIFLHSNKPPLVHGDLKPHNVLLDANFKSKIADFGFCRFLSDGTASLAYHHTNPKGTFGYIDPKFQETGELTPDCDVYSFGVTILRVLTGKEPTGIHSKVRAAYKGKSIMTIVDSTAGDWPDYVAELLAYFGLQCFSRKKRSSELMQEISNDLKNILTEHGIEVII